MAAPTPQSYTTWGPDVIDAIAREIERQRQELQPGPASEPDTEDVLTLAAIIREVNGNHALGAAALAEAILAHPGSRWKLAATPADLVLPLNTHKEIPDSELLDIAAKAASIDDINDAYNEGYPLELTAYDMIAIMKAAIDAALVLNIAADLVLHPAAPPDRDDFIDAAWGDMTPAEAVEGLEGLADDQWVPPTKEERVLARELLRLKAQGVDISNRLPSDPAQKMRWLVILDKMQKCLNSAAQLERGLRKYHASFPDSPHLTDS